MPSREAALAYPTGVIELAVCLQCGFIANTSFDPMAVDYTQPYEESQEFSPRFMEFAEGLADALVDRHDLVGKSVFEVGCGKGSFLSLLARRGVASAIGVDPSADERRLPPDVRDTVAVERAFFGEGTGAGTGDLVICRHTLEHIQPVRSFVTALVAARDATPDSALFIEVPDTSRILDEQAFWDVYYEHCSYFTSASLRRLIGSVSGVQPEVVTAYGDQYLLATALQRGEPAPLQEHSTTLHQMTRDFAAAVDVKIDRWRDFIESHQDGVVLWGGGSKGTTFLNTIGDISKGVAAVVDINPHLQGTYVAGTGHEIIAPERLLEYRPNTVIVMNPLYVSEITADLASLGLDPTVLPV
ncbi:MAG: methyltransferase domain-containing protein [Acidimicrobiia bacterium]|nr:methyltransferase domain-containing protein [Acidimicrobiia bacterium]